MKLKLLLFTVVASMFVLVAPNLAVAQDTSEAFAKYTNPSDICNFYRSQTSFVIERISDNECLVSLGTGKYKTFTQYYYSGSNWCYKLIQEGTTKYSNCIPRPDKTAGFNSEEISKFGPYIVVIVVLVVILAAVSSVTASTQSAATNSPSFRRDQGIRNKNPKPKKPGRIWREQGRKK